MSVVGSVNIIGCIHLKRVIARLLLLFVLDLDIIVALKLRKRRNWFVLGNEGIEI